MLNERSSYDAAESAESVANPASEQGVSGDTTVSKDIVSYQGLSCGSETHATAEVSKV